MFRLNATIIGLLGLSACAFQLGDESGRTQILEKSTRDSAAPVAIVATDQLETYRDVVVELSRRLGQRARVYQLNNDRVRAGQVLQHLKKSDEQVVIAVGLLAARTAKQLSGKQLIFCQVFNYDEAGLLKKGARGVSAVPSLHAQFRAWKALDPKLSKIGVITGANLDPLIAEARKAASAHGISLVHREARSDKEAIYFFKKIVSKVDGVWLAPDNRVLSAKAIRGIMAYGIKRGKQLLVFDTQLLPLGGVLSAESDAKDIVERVLFRLHELEENRGAPGTVVPLTRARVTVNSAATKKLGLTIPAELERGTHVY
jgi:ABC-type uncharacterized transport system substrate-binding protein